MIILGVDARKRTHTFVVVDEVGRKLAARTVAATEEGHVEALAWARRWGGRRFALEDCRHVTRRLEADLLAAGESVVRVPTKPMAGARRSGRTPGKSDPIDAPAVARAAVREPDLPIAHLDGATRQLRLLVDHREDLVAERTRSQSRLRWHLHELFPSLEIAPASLRLLRRLAALQARLVGVPGMVADIARELLRRCRELTLRANELERHILRLVRELAPTRLALPGCGGLSAAKIVGEVGGAARFRRRRSPAGTEQHRSPSGPALRVGIGWTAAAIAR